MAVRWYCSLPLSAARVVRSLAERDIAVSPRTGLNWKQTFGPQLAAASRRPRRRVGRHWTVAEGFWCRGQQQLYLNRAGDEQGQVIDVLRRDKRDRASAEAVCRQAVARTDITPDTIIPDHHQPYVRAVATVSRAPAMCVRGCIAVAATPPKLARAVTSPPAPGGEGREDAEPFALVSSV